MSFIKSWDSVIDEIVSSDEADKLSTTSIDVLRRLSEKTNPATGICLIDIKELADEVGLDDGRLNRDLKDLIRMRVIKKRICLDRAVISLHDRLKPFDGEA